MAANPTDKENTQAVTSGMQQVKISGSSNQQGAAASASQGDPANVNMANIKPHPERIARK